MFYSPMAWTNAKCTDGLSAHYCGCECSPADCCSSSVRCWLPTPPLTRGRGHWNQKNISLALKIFTCPFLCTSSRPMINCLTCDELWENIDCGVSATRPTSSHTGHKHCTGRIYLYLKYSKISESSVMHGERDPFHSQSWAVCWVVELFDGLVM